MAYRTGTSKLQPGASATGGLKRRIGSTGDSSLSGTKQVGTRRPKLKYGKPSEKHYSSKGTGKRQSGQKMPSTNSRGSSGVKKSLAGLHF